MSIKRGTSAQEDKRTNQLQANVMECFSISARVVWQVYSTKSKETTRSMFSLHAKCYYNGNPTLLHMRLRYIYMYERDLAQVPL